jgi:hypothetical protein
MRSTPRLLGGFVLLIGLLVVTATPVAAATPMRTWSATIGTSRVLAAGTLTLYPSYTGATRVTLFGLSPGTTYQAMIYKGTCASPTAVVRLPGIPTDAAGNGVRTAALNFGQGVAAWTAASRGSIGLRVATGSTFYCSKLTFPVATRVQLARYGIDLPIVHQPAGTYPYCNVAMYSDALSQPGEAGPTFIYAHARVGMFLPLLKASQSNAAAMVGTTVKVWTSDSRLWTYRITRVLRHQYSLPSVDSREVLWLQTSEGPRGTRNKLVMIATRVSVQEATFAASHPKPHIVICH